jgi:hypothetical protein
VSAEVDYLIRRRGGCHAARAFLSDVAEGRIRVESLTAAEHRLALEVDARYDDLDVGLADLSVVSSHTVSAPPASSHSTSATFAHVAVRLAVDGDDSPPRIDPNDRGVRHEQCRRPPRR